MRFLPECGYETALRILASYDLPIRERSAQNAAPLLLHARNPLSSSTQEFHHLPRTSTPFGVSIVQSPALYSTSQFEQRSSSPTVSRNHSVAQSYLTSLSMVSSDPSSVSADSRSRIHTSDGRLEKDVPPANEYGPYEDHLARTRHLQCNPISPSHPAILDRMNTETARPFTAPLEPRIYTSNDRMESRTTPASGYGPYKAHLEPTRHPQYNPIKQAHPAGRDRMDPETARLDNPPVPPTSISTETLSRLLPPKRDLPFPTLAPNLVCQDKSATIVPPDVPESAKLNGRENTPPPKNLLPRKKAPEKKEVVPKTTSGPKLSTTPKKRAAPKKKATPKKRAPPRKKWTPRKGALTTSKMDISNAKKAAVDASESTASTKPLNVATTCRTASLIESNPLPADGYATRTVSLDVWIDKVNKFMEEGNGRLGHERLASESPLITAEWVSQVNQLIEKACLEQGKTVSEPLPMTADWINQVNEFMQSRHLEQAKKASETPPLTAEWIDDVNQFIENERLEQAKLRSETPHMTAEWISHVNEFIDQGKGHFENVEIWSRSPLITADWVNRVDDLIKRHTELSDHFNHLSDQVSYLRTENHELVEFISNFARQQSTCRTLSLGCCNHPRSTTSRLRTPKVQHIAQVKRPSKRELGPEYGLTPAERPSKRGRIPRRSLGSGYGL